jgi:hypothetical protein
MTGTASVIAMDACNNWIGFNDPELPFAGRLWHVFRNAFFAVERVCDYGGWRGHSILS